MRNKAIRVPLSVLALALPFSATRAGDVLPAVVAEASQAITWNQYYAARAAFEAQASAYWTSIGEKRRIRYAKRRDGQPIALDDYVLIQPPLYTGPGRPPGPPPEPPPEIKPRPRKIIPTVADVLRAFQIFVHVRNFTPKSSAAQHGA